VKSDYYKNKQLKEECYKKLTEILKANDPDASIANTKRKINSLRSAYRRELKKLEASRKSGAGLDDIYIPTLWYFRR
jgi:hypothetical protein